MKTKTSNKLNMLLIAITLLLIFVAGFKAVGQTGSWLIDDEEIGFTVNVADINLEVKQGTRTIADKGNIYLGTSIIETGKIYNIDDVTITNKEALDGYYIRCQVFAVVDGVTYNINNCITTEFYKNTTDNWMYNTNNTSQSAYKPMSSSQTLKIIEKIQFPASFINGTTNDIKGDHITLHLFIEGSAVGWLKTN